MTVNRKLTRDDLKALVFSCHQEGDIWIGTTKFFRLTTEGETKTEILEKMQYLHECIIEYFDVIRFLSDTDVNPTISQDY